MRERSPWGVSLFALLLLCPLGRAGLYLPVEKDSWRLPLKIRHFRLLLDDRQGIVILLDPNLDPKVKPPFYATQIVKNKESLKKKYTDGQLTLDEGVSLGGYYILLGESDKAIPVLEDMQKRDRKNFMLMANLSMAYNAQGLFDRADAYQAEVVSRSVWPSKYLGWPQERLRWQLRVEQFHLMLERQRRKENALLPPGVAGNSELRLDSLFPGARFAGPDDKYAAGLPDTETEDALPPDAAAIVQQLLLWLPQDDRLQWLLAEVYNAQGDPQDAESLMSKLVNKGLSGNGLREHREILKQAMVQPPAPPPDEVSWRPELRSAGVGAGIGLIVGMLLVFQLRQLFRRPPGASRVANRQETQT